MMTNIAPNPSRAGQDSEVCLVTFRRAAKLTRYSNRHPALTPMIASFALLGGRFLLKFKRAHRWQHIASVIKQGAVLPLAGPVGCVPLLAHDPLGCPIEYAFAPAAGRGRDDAHQLIKKTFLAFGRDRVRQFLLVAAPVIAISFDNDDVFFVILGEGFQVSRAIILRRQATPHRAVWNCYREQREEVGRSMLRVCLKSLRRSAPVLGRSSGDLPGALKNPTPTGLPTRRRPKIGALRPGLAPPPKRLFKQTLGRVCLCRWVEEQRVVGATLHGPTKTPMPHAFTCCPPNRGQATMPVDLTCYSCNLS